MRLRAWAPDALVADATADASGDLSRLCRALSHLGIDLPFYSLRDRFDSAILDGRLALFDGWLFDVRDRARTRREISGASDVAFVTHRRWISPAGWKWRRDAFRKIYRCRAGSGHRRDGPHLHCPALLDYPCNTAPEIASFARSRGRIHWCRSADGASHSFFS